MIILIAKNSQTRRKIIFTNFWIASCILVMLKHIFIEIHNIQLLHITAEWWTLFFYILGCEIRFYGHLYTNSALCNKGLKSQIIPEGEFTARASVAKRRQWSPKGMIYFSPVLRIALFVTHALYSSFFDLKRPKVTFSDRWIRKYYTCPADAKESMCRLVRPLL